jgi:hypothetical protein
MGVLTDFVVVDRAEAKAVCASVCPVENSRDWTQRASIP